MYNLLNMGKSQTTKEPVLYIGASKIYFMKLKQKNLPLIAYNLALFITFFKSTHPCFY